MNPTPASDIPARVLGVVVFLAGIGLLVYVFLAAKALFDTPPPALPPAPPAAQAATGAAPAPSAATPAPSAATEISRALVGFLQKLLVLLLMCVAASVMSSQGIKLYFAGRSIGGRAPDPTPPAPLP